MTTLLSCAMFAQLLMMTVQQQQQQQNDAVITSELDCDERASCSYADEPTRNCYCDDLCHVYDDCCADHDVATSDAASPSRGTTSCQRLSDVLTRHDAVAELYVVSRCPSTYDDDDVRRRCQLHASDNAADRFYRVPVVVRDDPLLLTYRNVYCAACTVTSVMPTFYIIQVMCRTLPTGPDVSVASLLRSVSCRVLYVAPPTAATSSRTCRAHIGRCDRRWADAAVIDSCRRGPVSYVYAGAHAFRNRHCARCNYVNETYVSCDVTSLQRAGAAGGLATWRTAATIDVNRRRSVLNYVERHHRRPHQAMYELPDCRQQHAYDPFTEQCRLIPSLQLADDYPTTEQAQQRITATSSVAVVNASDGTMSLQFSLYAVRTRAERLTALLVAVLSTMALLVVVVVIAPRPALRTQVHDQTVLGTVISLLLSQLVYLLVVPLVDVVGSACFSLSVVLHYSSLASLCWLNSLAVNSLESGKCRGFARGCVYAVTAPLPVVVSVTLLSVLRLDGSLGGPACWILGLGQLILHSIHVALVLGVNCALYAAAMYRRRPLGRPAYVSMLLTLILMTDAVLTVAAAVQPQSVVLAYLSLAMHAALGPLVSLATLLPLCLRARSSPLCQRVTLQEQ